MAFLQKLTLSILLFLTLYLKTSVLHSIYIFIRIIVIMLLSHAILSHCADITSLGRMNPSMLSDQQMVELLYTPDDYNHSRRQLQGDADDVCTWRGIYCTEAKEIEAIDWYIRSATLKGSIDFHMLPPLIKYLEISDQRLRGEIDARSLPDGLEYIIIVSCLFTGTLDLGGLPRAMKEAYFKNNHVTAVVNLENFPALLDTLSVQESHNTNKSIRIGKLPQGLRMLIGDSGFTDVTFADPNDAQAVDWEFVL